VWADKESILSLDGGTYTLINQTVKLVLGDLALVVIYGLATVIHTKRIARGVPLWVESREAIKPRPSQLEPCVLVSPHTAPDILSLRVCLCEVQIGRVRIFQLFSPCCSYARNRDRIHVLLLDSFCPNCRGFHLCDVDVPFLHR
jgi:hypothetical protein